MSASAPDPPFAKGSAAPADSTVASSATAQPRAGVARPSSVGVAAESGATGPGPGAPGGPPAPGQVAALGSGSPRLGAALRALRGLTLSGAVHAGVLTAAALWVTLGPSPTSLAGEPEVVASVPAVLLSEEPAFEVVAEPPTELQDELPPLDADLVHTTTAEEPADLDPEEPELGPLEVEAMPPGWPWTDRVLPPPVSEQPVSEEPTEAESTPDPIQDPDPLPDPPPEAEPEPPSPAAAPPSELPGDHGPTLLHGDPPRYPRAAQRLRQEGAVELRLSVGADGAVTDVEIVTSSGVERLDEAAVKAVRDWRFEPAVRGGRAVAETFLHTVRFRLTAGS